MGLLDDGGYMVVYSHLGALSFYVGQGIFV